MEKILPNSKRDQVMDRIRAAYRNNLFIGLTLPTDEAKSEALRIHAAVDAVFNSQEYDDLSITDKVYVMAFDLGLDEAHGFHRRWRL